MKSYTIRTPRQLGAVLQGCRKGQTMTQAQAGARIGLPQKEVSKLELDPSTASLARVFRILSALDLEMVVRERSARGNPSEW